MKHLTNDDWVELLYKEGSESNVTALEAHIAQCETCQAKREEWQHVQQRLNQWEMPPSTKAIKAPRSLLPWALAAGLLLGLSFLFGYTAGLQQSDAEAILATIRTELQPDLDRLAGSPQDPHDTTAITPADLDELKSEMQAQLYRQAQQTETAIAVLEKESRRAVRKIQTELETVALVGERRYVLSQSQLNALGITASTFPAHYTSQPSNY